MAANTTYNIRIDSQIRKEADALYRAMGMTLSQAVNLFLTQSVVQGRLPLTEVVPGSKFSLIKAMEETELIGRDSNRERYSSAKEMFAAMDAEDEAEEIDA
ncbi:MAG: type II toxin-antitoxin system RelB/DinJ family antitoxin [Clostridiales bacterium]|jgi:DNA-damage-inducible protein J|nr:type II toxin-antitoxin system RelB/DinJ family antitoxin [Clostridiales bacterium]